MPTRTASATWRGSLTEGSGEYGTESGAAGGPYSFSSRFEEGTGSNPEELIGAAHAGCFSMALSHGLSEAGHEPDEVRTTASVHLDKVEGGFRISRITLDCEARVPGIDEAAFQEQARQAKEGCPVSQALAGGPEIELNATLSA